MGLFTLLYIYGYPGYLQTAELFDELYYTTADGEVHIFGDLLETAIQPYRLGDVVVNYYH